MRCNNIAGSAAEEGEVEPITEIVRGRTVDVTISGVQAALLGIVQGVSEFLPISSSAHLVILPAIAGWPQPTLTFDAVLHGGTAAAALWYYRDAWVRMLTAGLALVRRREITDAARWLAYLAVGTAPAVVVGLLGEAAFEKLFAAPRLAAGMLLLSGLVMAVAELWSQRHALERTVDGPAALVIGAAQALAIVPGLSRSGMTISAGLLVGLGRQQAARFSFLLAGPITAGAFLQQLVQAMHHAGQPAEPAAVMAIGFVTTLAAGLLAIDMLLRFARRSSFALFAVYCWLFALGGLWLLR